MRHRVRALAGGDLDHLLSDQRAGERGAQQIITFVERTRTQHRKDEIPDELEPHIDGVSGYRTRFKGFFLRFRHLLTLTDIGGKGDDLRAVCVHNPP